MRPVLRPLAPLAFVFALLFTLTARPAAALGLCDPAGHFCVNVDDTSATVCTPLRPGGLTPATCAASDVDARQLAKRMTEVSHGALHMLDWFVVRFDDWAAKIMLVRRAAEPEVADGGAREAMHEILRWLGSAPHGGVLVEEVTPPTLSRRNGVQVARLESRFSTAGIGGAVISRDVAFEIRARDAAYIVTFDADRRTPLACRRWPTPRCPRWIPSPSRRAAPVQAKGSCGSSGHWSRRGSAISRRRTCGSGSRRRRTGASGSSRT
ncbi:MAG TPA: hypothetical protein VGL81_06405 [Polyangiaceae bacterium]|jgi:hypothetical protein